MVSISQISLNFPDRKKKKKLNEGNGGNGWAGEAKNLKFGI